MWVTFPTLSKMSPSRRKGARSFAFNELGEFIACYYKANLHFPVDDAMYKTTKRGKNLALT